MGVRERVGAWLWGKPKASSELGHTGTSVFAGTITEEYNSDLKGGWNGPRWTVYEKMEADGQIALALNAFELPLKAATYDIFTPQGADDRVKEAADFLRKRLFERLTPRFSEFVEEAANFWGDGVALFEIVWGVEGGRVVPLKFAPRLPKTVWGWEVGPHGEFLGWRQKVVTAAKVDARIPAEKTLLFMHRPRGSDFEGRGFKRDVYQHWFHKKTLYNISGLAAERVGVGVWAFKRTGSVRPDEWDKVKEISQNLRANQQPGIAVPENVDIQLLTTDRVTLLPEINHHDAKIAQAALVHFAMLGERSVGSFVLAKTGQELYQIALSGVAETIVSEVQSKVVDPLLWWNFGLRDSGIRLRFRLKDPDPRELGHLLELFVKAGVIEPDEGIEALAREAVNLPPKRTHEGAVDGEAAA